MQPEQQNSTNNQWQQPPQTVGPAPYATPVAPEPEAPITATPQPTSEVQAQPSVEAQPVVQPEAQSVVENTPLTASETTVAPGPPVSPTEPPVAPTPEPVAPTSPEVVSQSAPEVVSPEQVAPEASDANQPLTEEDVLLRWEGTEYLHHDRTPIWYVVVAVVTTALMVAAIMVFHSITFAILIPVMAVALIIYARRPPERLQYILSRKGLHVNDRLFSYDQFKSFGVLQHGAESSVVLTPRKRFQIGQTLYFPAEIGEQLVDMLAARLPMKEVKPDAVDQFLAKIHL